MEIRMIPRILPPARRLRVLNAPTGILLALVLAAVPVRPYFVATFENLDPGANTYTSNGRPSGRFISDNQSFNNSYSPDFGGIWSGWAVSSTTNTTDPAFTNQYSAITGSGANGSQTYGVA